MSETNASLALMHNMAWLHMVEVRDVRWWASPIRS